MIFILARVVVGTVIGVKPNDPVILIAGLMMADVIHIKEEKLERVRDTLRRGGSALQFQGRGKMKSFDLHLGRRP